MTRDFTVDEDKMCIDELRHRMKGLMTPELYEDDSVFLRFLRARNYNLDATETMLKKHVKWRKIFKVDDPKVMNTKPCEVFEKYAPVNHVCFDREGHAVLYSHFGNLDSRGMMKSLTRVEANHAFVYYFESFIKAMEEQSKKMNKPAHQWIWIFNFEDFSMSVATHRPTIEFTIEYLAEYEANYPERLHSAYLINASFVFSLCWNVVKPFIPKNTAKKVSIFGKEGWQEELRSIIDPEVLPAFLGGSRTDENGDPRCRSFIKYGGLIPEKYYLRGPNDSLPFRPEAKSLIINRMAKAEMVVEFAKAGSTIEWEYDIKGSDIEFAVLYRGSSDKRGKEVLEKKRVRGGLLESGEIKCEKPGKYVLEFDNTYSWVSQKEILYVVRVLHPEVKETPRKDLSTKT